MSKGIVIVFDGPDGAGKTTQLELTTAWLKKQGHKVFTTRASGGTEIGAFLRAASLSDAPRSTEVDVFISLAMLTAVGEEINQKRDEGYTVLVDRSPLSVVAYNTFGGQLQDTHLGNFAFERLMKLWKPDLCLYIDVGQDVANQRRKLRKKADDYFEKQNDAFHDRVRQGYKESIKILGDHPDWYGKLATIDGAPNEETVQKSVRDVINTSVAKAH